MSELFVTNVKKDERPNAVVCEFDLYIKKIGLIIRNCKMITGTKGNFITMPSRRKVDTEPPQYYSILEWDKDQNRHLQDKVVPLVVKELEMV